MKNGALWNIYPLLLVLVAIVISKVVWKLKPLV
jgi:hypothetical protein